MKEIQKLYDYFIESTGVSTDTRQIRPGNIFFALKGESFDGNKFVQKALDTGASYAVVDDPQLSKEKNCLYFQDSLVALQELATLHRSKLNIPVIGITGSNGKTTTKELIREVLGQKYQTYATKGNLNNHIGVPLSILDVKNDVEIAVIEMGANHVGEIDFLCKIAQPTHGVITNIGRAHLEGFGGYEGVKKAKGELYQWLKAKNGTFFINTDDDTLKEMLPADVKSIKYGCSNGDVSGERDNKDRLNLAVSISSKDGQNTLIKTNLIGDYNIDNILAATSIGRYFKVDMEQVRAAIENYIPDNNRSQLLEIGTNKFILDAYNANPTSMKLALQNLEHYSVENKVVILGDMMELGDDSQQEHEGIINQSLAMKINKIVLVGTQFKAVADAMDTSQTLLCFDTAIETKEWMQLQEFTNTVFLIKGSRKVQLEKIISD